MEQSSQNENVIKIENEICEILSDEVSIAEDPFW
jgi:hypothetical protein